MAAYTSAEEKRFLDAITSLRGGFAAELGSALAAGFSVVPAAGAAGAGPVDASTQRIVLASDDPAVVALAAILAKIIAAPATSAKQDTIITAFAGLQTSLDTANTTLAGILDHLQNATTQVTVV